MKQQTLGMMITSLRKEQGMTQLELAEKMGVTDELMQIKSKVHPDNKSSKIDAIIPLILKAVALAMGVAVLVLSILHEIDMYSGFGMLGIGLSCLGILHFLNNNN